MKMYKAGILGLGVILSGLGMAIDFSSADDKFAKRSNGANNNEKLKSTLQSFQAYDELYNTSSGDDRIYALTQIARSALYGSLLNGADKDKRKDMLKSCKKKSKSEIENGSTRQETHYTYIACLAGLAKISNFFERIPLALDLKEEEPILLNLMKVNGKYVPGFEGGGAYRILAGVYGNKNAKKLDLFDPKKAIEFSSLAIDTPARVYKPFPDEMSGADYYDNFYYNAQAYLALGMDKNDLTQANRALTILTSTIDSLTELDAAGALPKGREPEIREYKHLMVLLQLDIAACKEQSNWVKCMEDKLDD